jgi:hypothetical protein
VTKAKEENERNAIIQNKYALPKSNTKINMNNYTELEKLYIVMILLQLVLIRIGEENN